jgi:hypothetical protein
MGYGGTILIPRSPHGDYLHNVFDVPVLIRRETDKNEGSVILSCDSKATYVTFWSFSPQKNISALMKYRDL